MTEREVSCIVVKVTGVTHEGETTVGHYGPFTQRSKSPLSEFLTKLNHEILAENRLVNWDFETIDILNAAGESDCRVSPDGRAMLEQLDAMTKGI